MPSVASAGLLGTEEGRRGAAVVEVGHPEQHHLHHPQVSNVFPETMEAEVLLGGAGEEGARCQETRT